MQKSGLNNITPSGSKATTQPRGVARLLGDMLSRAKMAEHTFMVVVAVIIGVLGGFGAVAFRLLIKLVQRGRGVAGPTIWSSSCPTRGGGRS